MAKLSLSDRVKRGEGAGGGAQSRDAAPSHQQEPAEMGMRHLVRAPPRHLLSLEGVLGMSNPEEAFGADVKHSGETTVCLLTSLGTSRDSPEELMEVV